MGGGLLKHLRLCIEVAEWQEIIPPSKGEKIDGKKSRGCISCSLRGLRVLCFCLSVLLWEFLGSSLASLLSGYFWPRELRQFLFYGDIEDKKSEDEKVKEETTEEVQKVVVKEVTRLETKVDRLETKVKAEVIRSETKVNEEIAEVKTKVDKVETKVDTIIELLEELKNRRIF